MALFDKYQAAVGRAQGASTWFVRDDGVLNVGDIVSGTDGTNIAGSVLARLMLSPYTRTSMTLASAIQTVSVLTAEYGIIDLNYPSATTSAKLPIARVGATLLIRFNAILSTVSLLPGSNSAGSTQSVAAGTSAISCLLLSTNVATASNGQTWARLFCESAGVWQVADCGSGATPQRA